eukprot:CAMPEP_0202894252 /NCGR_PEP_ID=MMETSP1392-20130828/3696_1 /ASSEMBLY_ACC=CAM_ASM_000868 /TAXON_ID=225041 /ORGANISM="Chlamydomonas chlamydogama, Strain SAG 11-48b" /LENGTH=69 /DNA_ID=CAMNT_0049578889 /DNA_START=127 /DNA_END=336 /DNA_ORIENTATION=+
MKDRRIAVQHHSACITSARAGGLDAAHGPARSTCRPGISPCAHTGQARVPDAAAKVQLTSEGAGPATRA